MATQPVNIRNDEPYDVYIGRPSSPQEFHYGNPFGFGDRTTQAQVTLTDRNACVAAFTDWLMGFDHHDLDQWRRLWIHQTRHRLKGKRLGCFCHPNRCHGDVYQWLLDGDIRYVGIVGSRTFPRLDWVEGLVRTLPPHWIVTSGGAIGVDTQAEETARAHCTHPPIVFPPDKERYGIPRAFFERNKQIVDAADYVIGFWDGTSPGTRHSLEYAKQCGKTPLVFHLERTDIPRARRARDFLGL